MGGGIGGGFDTDATLPEGEDVSIGDVIVGQVERSRWQHRGAEK
jgi:hypothetical protein